jgi:Rieske Fe-S protein
LEITMNERRRFLQMLGSGVVAVGTGCGAVAKSTGGAGGDGAGGDETSSSGTTTGTGGATTTSSASTSSTTASSTTTSSTTTSTTSSSSGGACTANPTGTKLGQPSAYASDGLHIAKNEGVLIGRDAGGLYALTAICTHQGCDMSGPDGSLSGSDIICACHGSEFGPTGAVVHGPAGKALKALSLELGCDGFLYVNKNKTVASTVRLMA